MSRVVTSPSATKQVFRVSAQSTEALYILVEADNPAEAIKLAKNIEFTHFKPDWDNTDWEIVDAQLASDYDPDQVAPPEAYDSL